ncbi:E1-E2 ATPase-domain-containing protein [Aspergillus californicus]
MAACCAVGAFVIYHLISIHSRLSTTTLRLHTLTLTVKESQPIEQKSDHLRTSRLSLRGLDCLSCAAAVKSSLRSLPGVEDVSVSFHSLSASVSYNPRTVNTDQFVKAIECTGFEAAVQALEDCWSQWVTAANSKQAAIDKLKSSFQAAAVVCGLMFTVEAIQSWNRYCFALESILGTLKLVTAVASIAYLAAPTHREAYSAFTHGRISGSFLSSSGLITVLAAALHHDVSSITQGSRPDSSGFSLTSACMLMTVLLGGRLARDLVFQQSGRFPAILASAVPETAKILSDQLDINSECTKVPTVLLHLGDKVVVDPGDPLPADCVVITGRTSVLETIMRGETAPTAVGPGDVVLAGCMNCDGRIIAEVIRVGTDTRLGETLRAVAQASEMSNRSQHSSDYLLASFASVVVAFAVSSAIVSLYRGASLEEVLNRTATVLLCACPCTLGLGIPICHITAASNAHESRIILGSGPRLENAARARVVVFDKTGTLTYGRLQLQEVHIEPEWTGHAAQPVFWQMVGESTRNTKHPVSVLLDQLSSTFSVPSDQAELESPVLLSHEAHPGLGHTAVFSFRDQTYHLTVGNIRMMQLHNVYRKPMASNTTSLGRVFIAINSRLAGTVLFMDHIVPEAISHIQELHSRGFQTFMMTGDTKGSAEAIAAQVGIPADHVHGSLLPHDKSTLIAQLERQYGPVIMVGDNLNDAAALATSSFGIVVSHQTELDSAEGAKSSTLLTSLQADADALLLPIVHVKGVNKPATIDLPGQSSSFNRILYILDLAKETNKRVHQILRWSLAYNIIALCLASGILKALIPWAWLDFTP